MPVMPTIDNGNRATLLAVDLFLGLEVCRSERQNNRFLKAAIDATTPRPF
jgi:hypothetical protein